MDLRPAEFPIKCYKNDTLSLVFEVKLNGDPVDLSSSSVRMQVRSSPTNSTVVFSFTEGDGITVGGTNNNIITLGKIVNIAAGTYVYDMEITTGSVVKTYIKGDFIVSNDVSRT